MIDAQFRGEFGLQQDCKTIIDWLTTQRVLMTNLVCSDPSPLHPIQHRSGVNED